MFFAREKRPCRRHQCSARAFTPVPEGEGFFRIDGPAGGVAPRVADPSTGCVRMEPGVDGAGRNDLYGPHAEVRCMPGCRLLFFARCGPAGETARNFAEDPCRADVRGDSAADLARADRRDFAK